MSRIIFNKSFSISCRFCCLILKKQCPSLAKSIHPHFSTFLPTWDADGINKIEKKIENIKKRPGKAKFCGHPLSKITTYLKRSKLNSVAISVVIVEVRHSFAVTYYLQKVYVKIDTFICLITSYADFNHMQ